MSAIPKPLPDVRNPLSARFWEGVRGQHLVIQRCDACGYLRWPPAPVCPECLRDPAQWTEVAPTGHLYAFCTYYHSFDRSFDADVPYTVAYVVLDAGPKMIGRLWPSGADEQPHVGSRVVGIFEPVDDDVTLLTWRLATREDQPGDEAERAGSKPSEGS